MHFVSWTSRSAQMTFVQTSTDTSVGCGESAGLDFGDLHLIFKIRLAIGTKLLIDKSRCRGGGGRGAGFL